MAVNGHTVTVLRDKVMFLEDQRLLYNNFYTQPYI